MDLCCQSSTSYLVHVVLTPIQFLILGAVTALFSVVVYVWLPDSPVKAGFLSEQERVVAVKRVAPNKTGISEL
jgi:hypothetical protein